MITTGPPASRITVRGMEGGEGPENAMRSSTMMLKLTGRDFLSPHTLPEMESMMTVMVSHRRVGYRWDKEVPYVILSHTLNNLYFLLKK